MISQMIDAVNRFLEPARLQLNILYKGAGEETSRYEYQKKFIKFGIRAGDKVLDVGSGGYPFPLATHLADLHPGKTTHRTETLIKDGKPFTKCDIHDLPFRNKEFDFIYCSHVLEHVDDPARACDELMRVAKRGYIETPTKTSDILFNFLRLKRHHKWHITRVGNTLVFFEYDPKERKGTGIDDFYQMFHSKYDNPFQRLVRNNHPLFDNMFLWKGRFNYFVFNTAGELIGTNQGRR
jgi:SAM-dependent methyltransferase